MSNHSLTAQESHLLFSHKNLVSITHEQNIICGKTQLDSMAHVHTIICRQLLCRSRGLLSVNEKEEEEEKCIE